MLVSQDVVFKADIFPYEQINNKQLPLFLVDNQTLHEDEFHDTTHQFPYQKTLPNILQNMNIVERNDQVDHNVAAERGIQLKEMIMLITISMQKDGLDSHIEYHIHLYG